MLRSGPLHLLQAVAGVRAVRRTNSSEPTWAFYSRYELLDQLRAYKVRPAENVPPHKFETGTQNHKGLAGTTAAINYLADLGAEFGAPFAEKFLV